MKLIGDFFNVQSVDGSRYTVLLNADHAIFKAHFPGHPITPGVCLVQMVQELLSQHLGSTLYLRGIKNVKFTSVVSPVDNRCLAVSLSGISDEDGIVRAQALLTGADDDSCVFAKMSLILEKEPF